ncbi:MAG: rhamnulokinase [Halanaerobiaceae bacterium]
MSEKTVLAFDIGASNGRALLGNLQDEKVDFEVIHKFPNGAVEIQGNQYWDILYLFKQIKTGLNKAVHKVEKIDSIGIDTWAIDYGLLDKDGNLLTNPYFYRDKRTDGLVEEVTQKVSRAEIYKQTGIQFMQINTLYQLYADRKYRPWILEQAQDFLFIPDLLNYFLTGEKYNEYTNASTSQFFDPQQGEWAESLLEELNLPVDILGDLIYPGDKIGNLKDEIKNEFDIDYDIPVMAVGSHDTASAVAATPLKNPENSVYLSSGTWSLLGMELEEPLISEKSQKENFTNECGVENKIRFLKNICGLWLIQESKKSWQSSGKDLSYDQIEKAARNAPAKFKFDPNDDRFLNPDDMPEEIKNFCRDTGQPVPEDYGELARGIYESLAFSYHRVIEKISAITGKEIEQVHVVGGGVRDEFLCQLTADASGLPVITGPIEATSLGNIMVQFMALDSVSGLSEARDIISNSVELKEYQPGKL